jgi:hypothetical protein
LINRENSPGWTLEQQESFLINALQTLRQRPRQRRRQRTQPRKPQRTRPRLTRLPRTGSLPIKLQQQKQRQINLLPIEPLRLLPSLRRPLSFKVAATRTMPAPAYLLRPTSTVLAAKAMDPLT